MVSCQRRTALTLKGHRTLSSLSHYTGFVAATLLLCYSGIINVIMR